MIAAGGSHGARRGPPLNALIAATYIQYSRYLSPIDDQACSATELARLIATRRPRDTQTEGSTHVVGVHLWKRYSIAPFMSGARSRTTWSMNSQARRSTSKKAWRAGRGLVPPAVGILHYYARMRPGQSCRSKTASFDPSV